MFETRTIMMSDWLQYAVQFSGLGGRFVGSARCLKRFVFGVLCLVSTGWPLLAQASAPTSATVSAPPNILFILTDDMGYGDLTCYGKGAGVATPHIDSLASEGLRFTQFYVAAPLCSP